MTGQTTNKHNNQSMDNNHIDNANVIDIDKEELNITPQTIVAGVFIVVGIINLFCYMFGLVPIELDEAVVYKYATYALIFFPAIYGYWHNNSWTLKARIGDKVKNLVGHIGEDNIDTLDMTVNRRDDYEYFYVFENEDFEED